MSRSYYGTKRGLRNPFGSSGKRQIEKAPKLPSTVGLLLRLSELARREWVTTPIKAPAPCWANAALAVFQDVGQALYHEGYY
ncbi:hypothetical protein GCM10027348_31470 [Hymenobacter tenuis]